MAPGRALSRITQRTEAARIPFGPRQRGGSSPARPCFRASPVAMMENGIGASRRRRPVTAVRSSPSGAETAAACYWTWMPPGSGA